MDKNQIEWDVYEVDAEVKFESNTHTLTHFLLVYHVEKGFVLVPLSPIKHRKS
jgi:hypothetical protein